MKKFNILTSVNVALTFFTTLSSVSGRLMSKQMSTASESGYANGRTLS